MSPEDICNQALDQIRARATISSINPSDGSNEANICSRNYQARIDALSRSAHWNCLRFQAQLPLLKAAVGTPENAAGLLPVPPMPWLYEYGWPASPYCLKPRFIIPLITPQQTITPPLMTGGILALPWIDPAYSVPFSVAKDNDASSPPNLVNVILTNASQAIMVYTARVNDPTLWDANFVDAAVMTLAAWIAQPITGSTPLQAAAVNNARALILSARITDGNEGTTTSDHIPDWIAIRSGMPTNLTGANIAAWDGIGFPGGIFF